MVESIIENGVLSLDEAPIALPSFKFFTTCSLLILLLNV